MRTLSTLLFSSLCLAGFAQAKIKFLDAKQNFGFVKKGEKVALHYAFVNEGSEPLLISEAKAECSCTTVKWPTHPIPPGHKEVIEVTFDTAPTYDRQDRFVQVFSNAQSSPSKLRFKGVVLVDK